nr:MULTISPECIES: type II toxin-antitoxin system VapC family toxin [unclassified Actinomyces]
MDTNVISEPLRPSPDLRVVRWLDAQPPTILYTTALTVAELRTGVAVMADGRRRDHLRERLEDTVLPYFEGRVLPFDLSAATSWATMVSRARAAGRPLPVMDSLIAAVARSRGYALATRNTGDFVDTGVDLVNPWED